MPARVCSSPPWWPSSGLTSLVSVPPFDDRAERFPGLADPGSWVYAIDAALAAPGLVVAAEMERHPLAPIALVPLLAILALFAHERRGRLESLLELESAYRGTALVLGDVVEADDGYTGEHCKSVVELTMSVAAELGLDAASRRNLEFGALLHDVGKIAIPKSIINKPGKLDPEEWSIIKTHTIEGQRMLERVGGFMREVGQIVRSHHERWDGGGYPDHLAGEEIPIEARIIGCCDAWNAMRTDRAYRQALPYDTAVAELLEHSGTQFDPKVVTTLLRIVHDAGDSAPVRRRGDPGGADPFGAGLLIRGAGRDPLGPQPHPSARMLRAGPTSARRSRRLPRARPSACRPPRARSLP